MKRILLKGRSQSAPSHSLYKSLLTHPPDGYRFFAGTAEAAGKQRVDTFSKRQQLFYNFDNKLRSFYVGNVWREAKTLLYMGIKKTQNPRFIIEANPNLIYASQQLLFINMPWVVDFEFANALVDYGDIRLCRGFLKKALSSRFCKKVMPWSEWAKRTLLRSLDCSSFEEKIEVVRFGLEVKDFVRKKNDDKVRLLFVGSTNQLNYLNFEWKGGFEVVEAFLELNKKYDNIELVIRSWVPQQIIEKCISNSNIKLLCSSIDDKELSTLYASSDIFMFPSYLNLGMVILEAMSYELPVIAPKLYDVPEAIEDMKTGILLDSPNLPFYIWNGCPNHHDPNLLHGIRKLRQWRVKQIIEKVSILIEDASLRRKIGRNARHIIESKFSIKTRNEKLKRIFDEAT